MPDALSSRGDPDKELGKLCAAIHQSRLQLRFQRQKRLAMVRQSLGSHYSEDAAEKPVPINLLAMAENILGRKLIPKNPRVLLSTFERRHRPAVHILQEWCNAHIDSINLANTLRRIVKDALYFIGIAKVAIASPADVDSADWSLKVGQPVIERVDFDDFVYDVHARDFSECGYLGHRIRVPLALVHESKYFGPNRKKVTATPDAMFNLEGDERLSMIGRGYYTNTEEYAEFVDLWEIWLRRENVIITLVDDAITGETPKELISSDDAYGKGSRRALRVQKWLGPACGPYHILGYNLPPDNPMAKGPLHDIYDLHLAINDIGRKLIRQARNTKRITIVTEGGTEDGKRINETNDGYSVSVKDAKSATQIVMNEPNQPLALLMESFITRASWLIGNLDLMGGLGPQAKTATQDKLNSNASSENIGSLQEDTLNYVADVLRSYIWFQYHHPTNVQKITYAVPNLPRVQIVRRLFPDNPDVHQNDPNVVKREHDFEAMAIRVDPFSLQHQTPQSKAAQMVDAVRNIYLPMAQVAMQQGVGLDLNAFFRKLGEYYDDPDLEEIFAFMQKPPEEGGEGGQGKSGVGELESPTGAKEPTEIIRRGQGADSQQAKEALVGNMMAKGAGQAPTVGAA